MPFTHALRRHFAALLLLIFLPAVAHGQDKADSIDALVVDYHDAGLFNGSVLVAEGGSVIYKNGFGYADMAWDVPNTPDTKFRIGSVTKQFTAAIILQLVEEGALNLDDPVSKVLPDYPKPQGDQVTIHHLLTHTSGIPSYTGLPDFAEKYMREPYEPAAFIKVFWEMPLEFEPGSEWRYNNSGYYLLGVIIEKLTGQPYDRVLRERILDRAGLDATGYAHYADVIERAATGYQKTPVGYARAAYLDTSIPYAAGMMYSTVEDLYAWDRYLYTDDLFHDPATKEKMFTPYMNNYGYGWSIQDVPVGDRQVKLVQHGGGINGFITTFMRLVDDEHLVVLMDNTSQGHGEDIARGIINILYGEPAGVVPKPGISDVLGKKIEAEGIEAAVAHYRHVKASEPDAYDFGEQQLNQLGYYYLRNGDVETAIAIFEVNVEAFPNAFNPYDSLGEAYIEAGDAEQAIANYQKSLDLNPGNTGAKEKLAELGVEMEDAEAMALPAEVLERYVGTYQIAPGFNLTVTREGTQLKTQATGQSAFDIFPQSETRFYVKAFPAQLEFHIAEGSDRADSVTLFQNGQETVSKRVE